jgi:tellurite resistance protein TehA-like permease
MEEQKPWYQSKTIVSLILAAVAVLAEYAPQVNPTVSKIVALLSLVGAGASRVATKKRVVLRKRTKKPIGEKANDDVA